MIRVCPRQSCCGECGVDDAFCRWCGFPLDRELTIAREGRQGTWALWFVANPETIQDLTMEGEGWSIPLQMRVVADGEREGRLRLDVRPMPQFAIDSVRSG